MSRYVPPQKRNRAAAGEPPEAPAPAPVSMEEQFPVLSPVQKVKVFSSASGKSFANLASEWATKHAEEKQLDELRNQEMERIQTLQKQRRVAPLPHFHNVRHFVEPEDEEEEEEKKPVVSNPEDEGWIQVKPKKLRKPKTFEQRVNRPPTPEEAPDGTVWEAGEDNDSYWKS